MLPTGLQGAFVGYTYVRPKEKFGAKEAFAAPVEEDSEESD